MKTLTLSIATALLFACSAAHAASFPKGSPKFESSLSTALAKAKEEGKPVVVVFSAIWCGPCQMMKKEVYPSKEVKEFHDKFVWVYVDVDEESNAPVVEKYGVEPIPHIEFLTKKGKKIDRQLGGVEPQEFASILRRVLKKTEAAPKITSPAATAAAKNK